jgi:hypothetical protein
MVTLPQRSLVLGSLVLLALSYPIAARAHGDVDEARHEKSEHAAEDDGAELDAKRGEKPPPGYRTETRRNGGWLAGGVLLLGVGYGVGIALGSQPCGGPHCYGAWPYVPVVGPIGAAIAGSDGSAGLRVGLVIDALAQGLSVYMIVRGFQTHDVWVRESKPSVSLVPMLDHRVQGLALVGSF